MKSLMAAAFALAVLGGRAERNPAENWNGPASSATDAPNTWASSTARFASNPARMSGCTRIPGGKTVYATTA